MRAWEVRPERLEAAHALAVGLRQRGLHRAAHRFTSLAAGMRAAARAARPPVRRAVDLPSGGCCSSTRSRRTGAATTRPSIAACRRLLAIEELPEGHRKQTLRNMNYAVQGEGRADRGGSRRRSGGSWRRARRRAGFARPDALTPPELRAPGLARRLAELCGMPSETVDRRLLGLGSPLEVDGRAPRRLAAARPARARATSRSSISSATARRTSRPTSSRSRQLIVDLGASIGITTLDLARRYPSAHIVAVEMDAASVALCAQNLEPLARPRDRSSAPRSPPRRHASRTAPPATPATTPSQPTARARRPRSRSTRCSSTRRGGRIVDYLKMNIEGSEQAVLRAGGRWPRERAVDHGHRPRQLRRRRRAARICASSASRSSGRGRAASHTACAPTRARFAPAEGCAPGLTGSADPPETSAGRRPGPAAAHEPAAPADRRGRARRSQASRCDGHGPPGPSSAWPVIRAHACRLEALVSRWERVTGNPAALPSEPPALLRAPAAVKRTTGRRCPDPLEGPRTATRSSRLLVADADERDSVGARARVADGYRGCRRRDRVGVGEGRVVRRADRSRRECCGPGEGRGERTRGECAGSRDHVRRGDRRAACIEHRRVSARGARRTRRTRGPVAPCPPYPWHPSHRRCPSRPWHPSHPRPSRPWHPPSRAARP